MNRATIGGLNKVRRLLRANERFEQKYGMNFKDFTQELDRSRRIGREEEQDWRRWDMIISELQPDDTNN